MLFPPASIYVLPYMSFTLAQAVMPDFRQALGSHLGWVKRQVSKSTGPYSPTFNGYRGFLPRVERPKPRNYWPLPRTGFKNKWSSTSTPHIYVFMTSTRTNLPSPPDKCRDGTLHWAKHPPPRLPYLLFTNQKIWSNIMWLTESIVKQ